MTTAALLDLAHLRNGQIDFRPHRGQWRAWQSRKRFVLILAGTQGGKTAFGPHWLYREIQQQGPGDYLVVTPTFQLLERKALPEFKKLFERWLRVGRYQSSPGRKFTFSPNGLERTFGRPSGLTDAEWLEWCQENPTTVYFGYAEDPESLESMTAKACWCDEAGQKKFKPASWEAIQRRLAIYEGRALFTTTPYDLGYLKQKFYDPWNRAGRRHPEIDVIRFDSTENPVFPRAEYDRARRELPAWKFNLFYRAIFTRPAGMIYDSFIDEYAPVGHLVPRFNIPHQWRRFVGLDFGGVNTAAGFYAEEPGTRKLYLYRTYHAGGRTAAGHVKALLKGEPGIPLCVGGSKSEGQWRQEFRAGGMVDGERVPGLPVLEPPIKDVEVGINRVYGCHRRNEILVFDDLEEYLSEKMTYSRVLDEQGEPTEAIEDKSDFHLMDQERYLIAHLRHTTTVGAPVAGGQRTQISVSQIR